MTITLFLLLLTGFATLSGLCTEGIKRMTTDKVNIASNVLALIVALIVGGVGTVVYYQLNAIPFTTNNIIYIVLMGLASGLVSMVGYDKVMQAIKQLSIK